MIIRRDLPLGALAAQLIHAAGETSPGSLPDNTHAIALAVDDEESLLRIEDRLTFAGIPHKTIREPDLPYLGSATAIGIVPCRRSLVRKLLSGLPLLKG